MDSRERIVMAASEAFAETGFHGVRMEHVAARAGLNKALVYRHFGDKAGLFAATVRRETEARQGFLDELPDGLAEVLAAWWERQRKDRDYLRLILEEGLRLGPGEEPVEAEARRDYYARQVDMIRAMQAAGQVTPGLKPGPMFFALLLLSVGPILLPQVARLAMGEDAEADWGAFLEAFAAILGKG